MPRTIPVNGDTQITSAFWNPNVRDQVVSQFATAAARDASHTAAAFPAGAFVAQTTNNVDEGLYGRTSAGTWRRPWNMPWGLQGLSTLASNSGAYTGAVDILYASADIVANRRYQIVSQLEYQAAAATDIGRHIIRDSTAATDICGFVAGDFFNHNSGTATLVSHRTVFATFAAGSRTFAIKSQRAAGSGDLRAIGSAGGGTTFLAIIDIGPSGAPT